MHHDAIIVGGSFAGLSAATYLARARRSVCVINVGQPRNRFADQSYGFFAQDGSDPRAMLATAGAQVAAYPTVTFVREAAAGAWKENGMISVGLDSGKVITGSKLLLAFGISDILPDIPGLAERWGKSVIHCPYCHGFEFSGQRLGVLNVSPMSQHQALVVSDWGPTTFYLNGAAAPDDVELEQLMRRNINIESLPLEELAGNGSSLSEIRFRDGRSHPLDALFISPRNYLNSPIAGQLGCEIVDYPIGSVIRVDEAQMTSVADVYAAGDIARESQSITFACADGVRAAIAMHHSFVFDDRRQR